MSVVRLAVMTKPRRTTGQGSSLGEEMDQRRVALRLTWREVAERAGLSIAGLGAIRRGERQPTAVTRARIDDALEWAPGSIDAILSGGEPTTRSELVERQPTAYGQGYRAAQHLDSSTLAAVLRSIDSQLLLAELGRRL